MSLRNVELVRDRVVRGMMRELVGLRQFLSSTDNHEAVELLRGEEGDARLARLVDKILAELGHETAVTSEAPQSQTRRKTRGAMGHADD